MIGDVGQAAREEIDWARVRRRRPGRQLRLAVPRGPPAAPGRLQRAAALIDPVLEQQPLGDGYCAIIGGYVVRDAGLPTLAGRYLYGDFCQPAPALARAWPARDRRPPAGLPVRAQPRRSARTPAAASTWSSYTRRCQRIVDGAPVAVRFRPPDRAAAPAAGGGHDAAARLKASRPAGPPGRRAPLSLRLRGPLERGVPRALDGRVTGRIGRCPRAAPLRSAAHDRGRSCG